VNADLGPYGVVIAIVAMAAVTYPMRAGGYWLMGHVPLTPRLRRILEALPGTVVVATVLPILLREGVAAGAAIAAALLVTFIRRNDFVALIAGVGAAAAVRAMGF
jgi:uncharacterized membrane protein